MGLTLATLQIILMTGLGPVFHSGELPYQVLGISLLLGHALGYRMHPRWRTALACLCALTPGALVFLRCLSNDPEANSPAGLALGLGLSVLATAGLAHMTLYWWAQLDGSRDHLVRLYSLELLGSACGLLLAAVAGPLGLLRLFPWLVSAAFAFQRPLSAALGLAALIQTLALPSWIRHSAAIVHGRSGASKVLATEFSPYQLVEAVEYDGQRYLFLNGLCHHNPGVLRALNYYLSTLPSRLLTPTANSRGALILGGGALLSATETRRAGLDTTVVELDPVVLRISRDYFASGFGLDTNDPALHLVCNDARAYTRRPQTYGLIVFSLPYPYSINVASMFTREYFTHLKTRLAPDGIMTVFLGASAGRGGRLDPVALSIWRSLRLVFPHTLAISSQEMSNTVVLCSQTPIDRRQVARQCVADGFHRFHFLAPGRREAEAPPVSMWDLRICAYLNLSLWRD